MTQVVETIHDHFQRQATPDVWAEVDALRKRVTELEALVVALRAVNAASADTLPKGQDAQQGLAGTESGAVGAAETPNPSPSPSAGR